MRVHASIGLGACLIALNVGAAFGQGSGPGVNAETPGAATGSSPMTNQAPPPMAPLGVQGVAAEPAPSPNGLAKPTADGIGTIIVPARPCGVTAHETDGTTTCVGIYRR